MTEATKAMVEAAALAIREKLGCYGRSSDAECCRKLPAHNHNCQCADVALAALTAAKAAERKTGGAIGYYSDREGYIHQYGDGGPDDPARDEVSENETHLITANDYSYRGWVVCQFLKRSGAARLVVEDANGRLFIHNEAQVTTIESEVMPPGTKKVANHKTTPPPANVANDAAGAIARDLRRACGYQTITPEIRRYNSSASNGLVVDASECIQSLASQVESLTKERDDDRKRYEDWTAEIRGTIEDWKARVERAESAPIEGWRDISCAPKDGTWFLAYRQPPSIGSWDTLIATRWSEDDRDFIWPDHSSIHDPFTPCCSDDNWIVDQNYFEARGTFTHWQPLPAPPNNEVG